ncbi:MAG TPA: adenosylhomocysteinase, partial [Ktedonobacterales bacterium]|nr:adenosylhomocysteinase [Ktedonobacterales bacterium]
MSNPDGPASDPLVEMGWRKIWWAERHMRLLKRLREEFERTQPFAGMTIGMCIHVEPKTAVLCNVLRAGGAKLVITGSPGTTKDDVAAALRSIGVTVLGRESESSAEHLENIRE